jgi:hypothetical protein
MKKTATSKPAKITRLSEDPPKAPIARRNRVFGSAKGQIVLKKGWDAPMTKRELDDFLGG